MLSISNISWTYKKFTHQIDLIKFFNNKCKDLKLKVKVGKDGENIIFQDVEANKLMVSLIDNRMPASTKKRREELMEKYQRDYLKSKRPTKKQVDGFYSMIHHYLDELGLSADIELETRKTKQKFVIRKGKEHVNNFPETIFTTTEMT